MTTTMHWFGPESWTPSRTTSVAACGEIVPQGKATRDKGTVRCRRCKATKEWRSATRNFEHDERYRKLHRRVQQMEAEAERKVADLQSQLDRQQQLRDQAKAWADEHLAADWTTDLGASWWVYTSANNRAMLTHLFERIRDLEAGRCAILPTNEENEKLIDSYLEARRASWWFQCNQCGYGLRVHGVDDPKTNDLFLEEYGAGRPCPHCGYGILSATKE